MIEKIVHEGKVLAIILYKNFHQEGVQFLTDKEDQLQLGYMSHPAGYEIKPHIHKLLNRKTIGTHEVLIVKSGVVRIDIYSYDRVYLASRKLSAGDVILLEECGHGVTMLEAATMIEVKNGPFLECKERFKDKRKTLS